MDPILITKLHIPAAHPGHILRPQLINKLNIDFWIKERESFFRRLTLISAPAGYGKSTLLYEWVHHLDLPVAWVTFDDSEDRLRRFLQYLSAALQTIKPGLGQLDFAAFSPSVNEVSDELISNIVIYLVNELAQFQQPFLIVFDDFHTLQAREIHRAVALFMEHLPSNVSLVISTRADPPLPLARLRTRRQVTEIRARDLQFSEHEACRFFQQVMKLDLKNDEVQSLVESTEGWVTGLQMAALALQGNADCGSFIQTFNGRNHFVIDYLFEEVLSRQSKAIQDFLMQTSILSQLSGELCDAVWQHQGVADFSGSGAEKLSDSQSILEYLESANLFLVPLDNERHYYRYHHLFSDLLRHRLQQKFPGIISGLHRRAAIWFEEQGNIFKAFEHWISAADHSKAAQLVARRGYRYFEMADFQQLSDWLQYLPPAMIHSMPWLCVFHSWGLILTGRYSEAETYLASAEKELGLVTEASSPELREQYAHVAVSRAFLASRSQDAEGIFHYTELALKYSSPDRRALRSYVAFTLGTGRYKRNQYTLAQSCWREAALLGKEVGNVVIAINSLVALSELLRIQGKLHESYAICEEAARIDFDVKGARLPVSAEVSVGRARLHYEWNDFEAAEMDFAEAEKLMKFYPGFDLKVEYNIWLSGMRLVQGKTTEAAELILEIENDDRQPFYKSAAAFLACRIRYYFKMGDMAMVDQILSQVDWNLEDKNIFAWADVFIAYTRVLVEQKEFQKADDILKACLGQLESYELWTPAIRALVVQAILSKRRGDMDNAREKIFKALARAEPEGFMRIFIDEGSEVYELLVDAQNIIKGMQDAGTDKVRLLPYLDRLLVSFSAGSKAVVEHKRTPVQNSEMIEALTERELEVLNLIANGYSNKEIASHLFVTVGTVKTHTSNMYRKLGVIGRTKALVKARELNLI